jgi:hypothetical protein
MITVACVFVKGNVPYTTDYVTRLRNMVKRNLARPHRFVCLTEKPERFKGLDVETIEIPLFKDIPGWWSKLELFNSKHDLGERTMYLDLDVLVTKQLDPIVDYPSRFALVPPAGTFKGRNGLRTVRRYNSSVMVWDRCDRVHLLHKLWTPAVAMRLWGDQDYVGEVISNADTMPLQWFPRFSELNGAMPGADAKVVLCKVPKNHDAARQFPWFNEAWQ